MSENFKQYRFTHDTRFDFNTSYSRDDAIRYLMDDLNGPLREDIPESVCEEDIGALSYCEILELQMNDANTDFVNARAIRKLFENGRQDADDVEISDEKFLELGNELNRAVDQLKKYHEYMCDIVDEFAKGDRSELRKDLRWTINPDIPYITISSLKAWKKNKYQVVDSQHSGLTASSHTEQHVVENATQPKQSRTKMLDQEDAILAEIQLLGGDPQALPMYSKNEAGIKSDVKSALVANPLFESSSAFKNAWDSLLLKKMIKYVKKVSSL